MQNFNIPAADLLELIIGGPTLFETLRSAVELDLFTLCSQTGGMTIDELVRSTGIAMHPMRILLLGCTSMRLLAAQNNRYTSTEISERYLTSSSTDSMISNIQFIHHVVYRPMFHLFDAIKGNQNVGLKEIPGDGATLYQRLSALPELQEIFHNSLHASTSKNVLQLNSAFDFSRVVHLVDVGGGDGTALCSLALANPTLTGTVLESATVSDLANQQISRLNLSRRISTCPADAFLDSWPTADCFLFMHFLTIWSLDKNISLLKKAYNCLPSGGTVIIFDGMQEDDGTGPLRAARWSPYFLVLSSGEGMFYSAREYSTWLESAGFVDIVSKQTSVDHVALKAVRP